MTAAPPIPGEPDTERRTRYSGVTSTGPFNVGFDLYADGADFQDWAQVWVNSIPVPYSGNWYLYSPSGPIDQLPRPITDAQILFTNVQNGIVDIVGARRPRRLVQYTENKGVPARDQNQVLTDIIMTERERWDREGRIPMACPGETMAPLPPASTRANLPAVFDPSGNLTAAATGGPTAPVSAAMAPVIAAATLALARTAMGVGGAGLGLLTDSSGNFQVNGGIDTDATSQSVIANFHRSERHATAAITYTNPASSTLFSGFGYFVYALGGAVTFAINAGDQFYGAAAGASLVIPQGSNVYISTDGAGTWFTRGISAIGYNEATNLQLNATVASNALTIALKDRNGNDPSGSSPIVLSFRDTVAANGDTTQVAVSSALSITVPATATLGTTSTNTARIWITLFNNGGAPLLGVIVCTTGTQTTPLDETTPQNATAISTGANSGGVFYAASGLSGNAFRILGYLDITETTAGTWATGPSKIQIFGPGVKKPGDVVQSSWSKITSGTTITKAFTPTSAANPVRVQSSLLASLSLVGTIFNTLVRGATTLWPGTSYVAINTGTVTCNSGPVVDMPNVATSVTYSSVAGGSAGSVSVVALSLEITELMA